MTLPSRRASDQPAPLLSIVVPMYNEEEGTDLFFNRLTPVLEQITDDYEIVCVDDGSSDRTMISLMQHHARDPRIKVLSLSRNFGKDTALSAGLDYCRGQAVVPIDADLQDPPELIGRMVDKWREGYDVVYARRGFRDTDDATKRLTAGMFYRMYNWIAEVRIPDNTGDFRLMDRRVVEAVKHMPEKTRFMKGMFAWVGFKQVGIEYRREARVALLETLELCHRWHYRFIHCAAPYLDIFWRRHGRFRQLLCNMARCPHHDLGRGCARLRINDECDFISRFAEHHGNRNSGRICGPHLFRSPQPSALFGA
jgi:polyisoprenyl-phosphate glycosyltransferase